MTVKEQVESLIDVKSYTSCWRNTSPPSFGEFLKCTSSAFAKSLPEDAKNLRIVLNSQTDGRIATVGSFQCDGEDYDVFGEIVWVSKHQYFRGKPGFRKKRVPVAAPSDKRETLTPWRSCGNACSADERSSGGEQMRLVRPRGARNAKHYGKCVTALGPVW